MTSNAPDPAIKRMKAPQRSSPSGSIFPAARLLLCDDQRLVRIRVRQILQPLDIFEVVGLAEDGRSAVSMALQLMPDIILMDVCMPELDGIQATSRILAQAPDIRVLGYSSDLTEETAKRMLMAGAHACVSKTGDAAELVDALTRVLAGERFITIKKDDSCTKPGRD